MQTPTPPFSSSPATDELDELAESIAARLADRLRLGSLPLLDLTGAAARLNVSERTVESLVALGEVPVVRIGVGRGVRRFDPAALDAFIRRQTRSL